MRLQPRWLGLGAAVLAAVAAAAFIYRPWEGEPPVFIDWRDDALVAQGEDVYAAHCASCHGADLEGQPNWQTRGPDGLLPAPPHDDSGHTWHHPDAVLLALTKYGPAAMAGDDYRSAMPAYSDILTDQEIEAVLAFIKRQWSPAIRDRHDQLNAAHREQ